MFWNKILVKRFGSVIRHEFIFHNTALQVKSLG
jgi:hypothetical protein